MFDRSGFLLKLSLAVGISSATGLDLAGAEPPRLSPGTWAQGQIGGSVYDPGQENPAARGSIGLQIGRRVGSIGTYCNLSIDQAIETKPDQDTISFTQLGLGVDYLTPSGSLRVSASGGISILNADNKDRSAGTRGWYSELRPISVRWPVASKNIMELSPLALEVTQPLGDASLTIFAQYLKLSFGW